MSDKTSSHYYVSGRLKGLPKQDALFSRRDLRRGPAVVRVTSVSLLYVNVVNVASGKETQLYAEYFDRRYTPYVETPTGASSKP